MRLERLKGEVGEGLLGGGEGAGKIGVGQKSLEGDVGSSWRVGK